MGHREEKRETIPLSRIEATPLGYPFVFSVFSVPSVALILKFVAPRVELSDLLGGPGFSPAGAKFPSVGFRRCGKIRFRTFRG
jgi:hypothetical protein